MTDTADRNARRAAAVRAYCAAYRRLPAERVAALHARGLSDAAIAREVGCAKSSVRKMRLRLGLPAHAATRAAFVAAGATGPRVRDAARRARRAAECESLRLPADLSALGLAAVVALAGGPLTRARLAAAVGASPAQKGQLDNALRGLRRSAVVARGEFAYGPAGRLPVVWSLAPAVVAAAFSRAALAPLQQRVAASPRALAIAAHVSHAYARRLPHAADDIRSAAFAGLADAALRYDPSRTAFGAFAARRVRGAIQDALRAALPAGFRRAAAAAPFVRTGSAPGALFDPLAAAPAAALPVGWELESLDALDALTAPLPARERAVLRLYFAHGLCMREVGARIGVSESRVSGLFNSALRMLRASA